MKIRIKGNSIRFRLVKSEVKQLSEKGIVEDYTEFENSTFIYRLISKEGIADLETEFENNSITMFIPKQEANLWVESDRITYKNMFGKLSLLLEKDFVCLDHTEEDQSDNYDNPSKIC